MSAATAPVAGHGTTPHRPLVSRDATALVAVCEAGIVCNEVNM
jgi:hypothetical protein